MFTLPLVARSSTWSVRYILNVSRRSSSAQVTERAACFFPTSRSPLLPATFSPSPAALSLSPCSTLSSLLRPRLIRRVLIYRLSRCVSRGREQRAERTRRDGQHSRRLRELHGGKEKEREREKKSLIKDNNTWVARALQHNLAQ